MKKEKELRILFTCVGRRVELVQAFRKAAEELNVQISIFGTDITGTAPALFFCDEKRMVCRISDENYIPQLLKICENDEIDCLIPTIDTDLLLLAKNRHCFEEAGTKVLIASFDKVKICQDKKCTADYFLSLGLKTPLTVNSLETYGEGFPAFIKPRDGSSSINAYRAENQEDLRAYANKMDEYVIQPLISGKEFTVDIFCDYAGNLIYITPRERLAVRSGEVLKTRITQDQKIIDEMKILAADFRPSGQITVQLIRDELSGKDYYIEINPRFGGGAPLSMKAGADSAKAVIEMLYGTRLSYVDRAAADGLVYSRYDQSICVS